MAQRVWLDRRFGKLTVIAHVQGDKNARRQVDCRCKCGKMVRVYKTNLSTRKTLSCGCHRARVRVLTGQGARQTAEYRSWANMKDRCLNPNSKRYAEWGGRGIGVCRRWMGFAAFYSDMGPKPSPLHSIDRINNDGNYEPGNCRWATPKQQAQNRGHRSAA